MIINSKPAKKRGTVADPIAPLNFSPQKESAQVQFNPPLANKTTAIKASGRRNPISLASDANY